MITSLNFLLKVFLQFIIGETAILVDRQILGHLGQRFAFVRGHGVMVGLRPTLGDFPHRTQQGFEQARPEDGGDLPAIDAAQQRGPFFEVPAILAEARHIPDATAFQAHEQGRHPIIGPVTHRTARHRAGPVDLPIALEFFEEYGHELGNCVHGYFALHGHYSRDTRLGQAGTQGRQGFSRAVTGALAGGQHN